MAQPFPDTTAPAPDPDVPPLASVVNDNVRAEMARRNVTNSMVAVVLDRTRESVTNRINGRQEWRLSELDVLARYLGCDRERFLRGA